LRRLSTAGLCTLSILLRSALRVFSHHMNLNVHILRDHLSYRLKKAAPRRPLRMCPAAAQTLFSTFTLERLGRDIWLWNFTATTGTYTEDHLEDIEFTVDADRRAAPIAHAPAGNQLEGRKESAGRRLDTCSWYRGERWLLADRAARAGQSGGTSDFAGYGTVPCGSNQYLL
jgi:hypothetical protein